MNASVSVGPGVVRNRIRFTTTSLRRPAGTTLVELLLAVALFGMALVTAGMLFGRAADGYQAAAVLADRQQARAIAVSLLRYELALAGYRGVAAGSAGAPLPWSGPALEVNKAVVAGASDRITVRYLEDRWGSGTREISYEVAADRYGGNLYRRERGASRQPAVAGVARLEVVSYLRSDGSAEAAARSARLPPDLTGLVLELTYSWGERERLTVQLENPPVAQVAP